MQDSTPFRPSGVAALGALAVAVAAMACTGCVSASADVSPEHMNAMTGLFNAMGQLMVLPLDLIPDVFAAIGFSDDASVLLAAMRVVQLQMRPEHYAKARATLSADDAQQV